MFCVVDVTAIERASILDAELVKKIQNLFLKEFIGQG